MVRIKRIFFVIAPCLLLLFGVLASASAASPADLLQNCASGQCLSTNSLQCGTNMQQQAGLSSLLQNCASGQCLSTNSPQCGANIQQLTPSSVASMFNLFNAAR